MQIDEIVEIAPRDEYNDQFVYHFEDAAVIAKVGAYGLKQKKRNDHIYYGLFDENILVAYLHLDNHKISMVSVDRSYRGQGYATYLMDYAILNDGLTISSDTRQTPEAKVLWLSLIRNGRYDIILSSTREPATQSNVSEIWNGREDVYLIAQARTVEPTIDEINEQKRRDRAGRKEYFYGPGTSSNLYWNP